MKEIHFCLGNNMLQRCSYTGYLQFAGIKEGWPLTFCFIIHCKHAGIRCKWPSFHTVLLTCKYKSLRCARPCVPGWGLGTQLRGRVGWVRRYPFVFSWKRAGALLGITGSSCLSFLVDQLASTSACDINRGFSQTA